MAEKTIILKNTIAENVTISSLGLIIESRESSSFSYEDILSLEDSQELQDLIDTGDIVVNNGMEDLSSLEGLEYLQIGSNLTQDFYSKSEADAIIDDIVINEIDTLEQSLTDNYYTTAEVNQKIAEIDGAGIKGAVNYVTELPSNGNQEGDIYIVRSSIGTGTGGPVQFVPGGDAALYLPFDNDWQDILGHSGESHSAIDIVPGKVNNAGDFDGDDDWLEFYTDSDFGQGPTLSVGGWIYPRRTGTYGIIGRWSDSGDGAGWKIDVHGNKLRISFDTYEWCGTSFTSPNNLPTDQWVHIAMVYNGTHVIMYINGVAVNSVQLEGESIDSYDKSIYVGKYMGCYNYDDSDSADKYYDGLMDEMFVINGVLSQEDIEGFIFAIVEEYDDEGFYRWDGSEWNFLARNTGESGATISHENLLNLNSGDYQHITADQKNGLVAGESTDLHKHDLYYTKTEVDNNFSVSGHEHDTLYYNKTQVDGLLTGLDFADISTNDSSTNITGAELEQLTNGSNADGLHTHESLSSSNSGGLDEAYDNNSEWNQGQGRNVSVDYGPVQLTASNGFAPIRLTNIDYTPSQWLGGGEMCYRYNELFVYDASRNKWLGVAPMNVMFGRTGNNRTGYMRTCGEIQTGSGYGGFVSPWAGTIVGISCNAKNDPTGSFQIGIDGGGWDEFYWGGQGENSWDNININFEANERVTVWQDNDDEIPDYPTYMLFVKRRLS